jgi:hypothetical protein
MQGWEGREDLTFSFLDLGRSAIGGKCKNKSRNQKYLGISKLQCFSNAATLELCQFTQKEDEFQTTVC